MADPERAPHSLRDTSRARLYIDTATEDAQTNKTSFFFLVIPTVLCVQPQSTLQLPPRCCSVWLGCCSSRLLGGMRDTSASLTKIGLPPVSGFARKRHPPAECNHSLGLGVCSSSHGSPSWCQALPSSAPQQSPGQVPQISSWHLLGGGMGRGSLPLPSLQKSILMKEMTAGSAGWPGLPEGTAQCQGLAVLRVR